MKGLAREIQVYKVKLFLKKFQN